MKSHNYYMQRAIELSKQSISNGGGPFGAVIVKDGEIIAESSNSVTQDNDPTAHAEVNAIRKAAKVMNTFNLSGTTIYSSCEPCPMCLSAIYWARISNLFFANTRQDAQKIGFDDEFLYHEIQLPIAERTIPTKQILRNEALDAFKLWEGTENKIEY